MRRIGIVAAVLKFVDIKPISVCVRACFVVSVCMSVCVFVSVCVLFGLS